MTDWQQAVSLCVVALTAFLLVRSRLQSFRRRRNGGCGGDCCGADVRARIVDFQRHQEKG